MCRWVQTWNFLKRVHLYWIRNEYGERESRNDDSLFFPILIKLQWYSFWDYIPMKQVILLNKMFFIRIQRALYVPHNQHRRGSAPLYFFLLLLFSPPSPCLPLSTQPPLSPLCLHLCIATTIQYPARATESLGNEMASGRLNLPSAIRHLIVRRHSPHRATSNGQNSVSSNKNNAVHSLVLYSIWVSLCEWWSKMTFL